jgi:putative tricarboxylic transport membrane protein
MRTWRAFVFILAAMIVGMNLTILAPARAAEEWPSHPITFIVPTPAGGSQDTMARGLASFLGSELNAAIKIQNRPGANTQVGTTAFLETKDDGYTLMVSTEPYFSNSMIMQGAKYKIDDFDFINVEQVDPVSLTVHVDSPYKKFLDLIKAIQANPGKLAVGTAPLGGQHLGLIILADKLKLNFRTVMYTAGGPYRTALLGKQVDFIGGAAAGDAAMKPNARVLAIFDDEPFKAWPEAELINDVLKPFGVKMPNLASARFVAIHSSFKRNFPDRYQKLVTAYKKVFDSKPYSEFREKIGFDDVSRWMGPEKSNAYMKESYSFTLQYKDQLRPEKKN